MNAPTFNLDLIEVPNPCPVPWESMPGGDRVRHCGQCRKNVYRLSDMTRAEAEALVQGAEGELCVQFFRRADGTVVTKDCAPAPAKRSLVSAMAAGALSAFAVLWLDRHDTASLDWPFAWPGRRGEEGPPFKFVGGSICPPGNPGVRLPVPAGTGGTEAKGAGAPGP